MLMLWNLLTQLFKPKFKNQQNNSTVTTPTPKQSPAHVLGHASKCVWELDKEA